MKAKILNCTNEQYINDPCETPSLNYSTAKVLLQQSPLHAWMQHSMLGGVKKEPTAAMDAGTLIHKLLLGEGHEIVIGEFENFRTKDAQTWRDKARADNFLPILQHQFNEAFYAVEKIRNNLSLLDIDLMDGQNEFKIQFESDGVLCRRALDSWNEALIQIRELKTINNACPAYCAGQSIRMGYDVEYAASVDAIQTLYPDYAGRIDFVFIFCELEPPYAVYAARPDGVFSQLGFSKWDKAKRIWKACLETNTWPAYAENIGSLTAPLWAVKELIEEGYDNFNFEKV